MELSVDVLDLPDLQAPITYYENDNSSFDVTTHRQAPRAVRAGIRATC